MASAAQLKTLLSVPCPWCGAAKGARCFVRAGRAVFAPTTLDGECHDARWHAAHGTPARVLSEAVTARTGKELALAASGAVERPW